MTTTERDEQIRNHPVIGEVEFGIGEGKVPQTAHVAYFWETEKEFADGVRFLEAGLRGLDHCVIFGHEEANQAVCNILQNHGFDVKDLLAQQRITILGGNPSGEKILETIGGAFQQALARGAPLIRLLGNIGWGKSGWPGDYDLLAFEAKVTAAAKEFPCVVVCMYDVVALPGLVIRRGAYGTHPLIEREGSLQENPDYIPAGFFLKHLELIADALSERRQAQAESRRANESLQRSETYLAEAQRLSHTGSWAFKIPTREIVHWSQEHFRIFGFEPEDGIPSFETLFQRIHPDDRGIASEVMERGIRDRTDYEQDFRIVLPNGTTRYMHAIGHPVFNSSGDPVEFMGTVMDVTESKRAEEALRSNAQNSRLIIDSIPGLVCTMTGAGELELVNRQVLEYFGKTFEELKDWAMSDAVHPHDVSRVTTAWKASIETGEPYDIEHRIRRADGVYRWFHVRAFPQRDTQGPIIRWHVLLTDVDGRKRAEEKMRRSEASLLDAQRLSHTGSWTHDFSSGTVTISPETVRMWGIQDEDDAVVADFFFAKMHPEDRFRVDEAYREAQLKKADFESEFRTVLPDGTIRNIRSIGRPIVDEAGNVVEFVGAVIDITERKLAEEALRKSEERWRAVFENSAIGVALTDLSGRFLATNSAYQKMLGYTEEEIGKLTFLEITHEDYRESHWEFITELLEGRRKQFQIEKQYWRKDGSLIWVSNNVSLLPGTKSAPPFIMALSEDITERKRTEEALRKTQAELAHVTRVASLGEMTASIAHEVNQPLGAVVNSASACLRWLDAQKLEEARRSASRVIAEGHRASEIIGRIRALAKKAPPQKDWLDVNETIHEIIAFARSEIQCSNIALETQLSEHVPVILADRVQLQQVILNLMMNAVEAMSGLSDGPRELLVRSGTEESKHVVISVQDSGPGFDPESLDHLFEAFYTTKPQGLGMGLAISRSIVEAHGGRLWATVNAPRGAVFQFVLPVGSENVA